MKNLNLHSEALKFILFLVTIILFPSCRNDEIIVTDTKQDPTSIIVKRSTWETDNRFASLANEQYITDAFGFLDYVSLYFDEDTSNYILGYTPEEMTVHLINCYSRSLEQDTLTDFPSWERPMDSEWSAALKGKFELLTTSVAGINEGTSLSECYEAYNSACSNLSLLGLSSSQIDTLATVAYLTDITMNWWLNYSMWSNIASLNENPGEILPRFPNYPPGYKMTERDWWCAFGIFGGAYVGAAGGLVSVAVGAVFGGFTTGCKFYN